MLVHGTRDEDVPVDVSRAYRAALGELSLDQTPREWGAAQCNLGIELAQLTVKFFCVAHAL